MARKKVTERQPEAVAGEFISVIEKSEGGPALELALNKIGEQSLKSAKRSQQMMQEEAMKVLPELNSDSPLSKSIIEANEKTTALNPNTLTESLLYKIPFPGLQSYLAKRYIGNFQDQNQQVQGIFEALERGKDKLLMRMIDLKNQYETLKKDDTELLIDIEACKNLAQWIEKLDFDAMDNIEKMKYQLAENKIGRRIRDLTTIRSAIQQFFVSINQTMQNQSLLSETIDSLQTVGPYVLQNAIIIHAAINEQKQVAEAVNTVQNTISTAMEQNASMIKENAELTAEMYSNPVIAIESLKKSYAELQDAVDITHNAMLESTENAKAITAELENMQEGFKSIEVGLEESVKSNEQLKQIA